MSKLEDALKQYDPNTKDPIRNKFNYYDLSNYNDNIEDSHFYQNLEKRIIYFCNPSKFNDHDEFMFDFRYDDWKEIISKKRFPKLQSELISVMKNQTIKKFGVFCLANSNDDKHFWDGKNLGYVQNFNGVCCEYDVESILKNNERIMFKSVIYDDSKLPYKPEYVDLDHLNGTAFLPKKTLCHLGTKHEEYKKVAILTMNLKPTKWKVEKEQRMFILHKDHDGLVFCPREITASPVKIYIGKNVSSSNQEKIIQLCKVRNIKVYLMDDNLQFKLFENE